MDSIARLCKKVGLQAALKGIGGGDDTRYSVKQYSDSCMLDAPNTTVHITHSKMRPVENIQVS